MAGKFEAFVDSDSYFRFRLVAPDGAVVAISGPYEDKSSLAAGIATVRESAGTGLVTDLCPAGAAVRGAQAQAQARALAPAESPDLVPASVHPGCEDQRVPAGPTFILARSLRRQGPRARWSAPAAR